MPIEYSCFISYRHAEREDSIQARLVRELWRALSDELEMLTDKPVFLDTPRLKPGYMYNTTLSRTLCKSACMVMVYWPQYFSSDHTYCAREYKAMVELEAKRHMVLPDSASDKGMIIPIVVRGKLPAAVSSGKGGRFYADFSSFLLNQPNLRRHPKFAPQIKGIAEYIAESCSLLQSLKSDVCRGCTNFELPDEYGVKQWLKENYAPPKYVLEVA
jgi:hypothetical protein